MDSKPSYSSKPHPILQSSYRLPSSSKPIRTSTTVFKSPYAKIKVSDMDSKKRNSFSTRIISGVPKVMSDESALAIVYGSKPTTYSNTQEKYAKRKEEIKITFNAIKASECVDLVFLVDCTGSMAPYINQIKNDITKLYDVLYKKYANLDMKFGFIRYTDFDQGSLRSSVFDLSRSTSDFTDFISYIKAKGGGDGPEDVFGGMNLLKSMDWREDSTRVVIHIGDAPCHGDEFHDFYDDHPDGDPTDITLETLLEDIYNLNINYYFGHIDLDCTGQMISIFDEKMKEISSNQHSIYSFDSKDTATMNEKIFKSVEASISITRSLNTSRFIGRCEGIGYTTRDYVIDTDVPDFSRLRMIPMLQTKCILPPSISACLSSTYEMTFKEITINVKIAPQPFSQGAMRLAYYGCDEHGRRIVLKQSKFLGPSQNSKKRYFEAVECQTIAAKFALDFNNLRNKQDIKFAVAKVLQVKHSEKPQFYAFEILIDGKYEKFNSNCGWKSGDDMSDILQTFSHWTYHISKGKAIVVDIQGVKTSSTGYLLTDPSIHCEDILKFGSCNLGKPGIIKFFQTHKCNIHCEELGLIHPNFGGKFNHI